MCATAEWMPVHTVHSLEPWYLGSQDCKLIQHLYGQCQWRVRAGMKVQNTCTLLVGTGLTGSVPLAAHRWRQLLEGLAFVLVELL